MTLNDLNPDFNVTPLFDLEYLKNGRRYRHSYNGILIYTCPTLIEIFNDTKHREVFVPQLSFLFSNTNIFRLILITMNIFIHHKW